MRDIKEDLRFMSPLELVINIENEEIEEVIESIKLLSKDEQNKFYNECKEDFFNIKDRWYKFVGYFTNSIKK